MNNCRHFNIRTHLHHFITSFVEWSICYLSVSFGSPILFRLPQWVPKLTVGVVVVESAAAAGHTNRICLAIAFIFPSKSVCLLLLLLLLLLRHKAAKTSGAVLDTAPDWHMKCITIMAHWHLYHFALDSTLCIIRHARAHWARARAAFIDDISISAVSLAAQIWQTGWASMNRQKELENWSLLWSNRADRGFVHTNTDWADLSWAADSSQQQRLIAVVGAVGQSVRGCSSLLVCSSSLSLSNNSRLSSSVCLSF